MVETAAQILFYLLVAFLGAYSFLLVYVILRYGQSRLLGLALSAFYLITLFALFLSAQTLFSSINFPEI